MPGNTRRATSFDDSMDLKERLRRKRDMERAAMTGDMEALKEAQSRGYGDQTQGDAGLTKPVEMPKRKREGMLPRMQRMFRR